MPRAFQVFAVEKFSSQEEFKTEEQLSLLGDSEQNVETTITKGVRSVAQPSYGFTRYDVEHDFLFHLEYPGRARGKVFQEFVTPYKFPIFVAGDDNEGLGFRPLLVRTKKKVASDFIGKLNRSLAGFSFRNVQLDFSILRPRLQLIRGAWFGKMQRPNLASTGVFGHHVDLSEEFQHAETSGQLTNLMVELEQDNIAHTVMLGADGAIVLYRAYQTDDEELAVVSEAMSGILAGCLAAKGK